MSISSVGGREPLSIAGSDEPKEEQARPDSPTLPATVHSAGGPLAQLLNKFPLPPRKSFSSVGKGRKPPSGSVERKAPQARPDSPTLPATVHSAGEQLRQLLDRFPPPPEKREPAGDKHPVPASSPVRLNFNLHGSIPDGSQARGAGPSTIDEEQGGASFGNIPVVHFRHISQMQPHYRGEEIKQVGSIPVKYFSGKELEQYRVTGGPNGEALDGHGRPLDTTRGGAADKAIGTLDTSGRIYIAHRAPDDQSYKINHSSFVRGGAVAAAFEIHCVDGTGLVLWPNRGHYLTTSEQMEQLRQAFRLNGITADIRVEGLSTEPRQTIF